MTVRPNTERPVTIEMGTNRLVPGERWALVEAAIVVLSSARLLSCGCPEVWDGQAAERIVQGLLSRSEVER